MHQQPSLKINSVNEHYKKKEDPVEPSSLNNVNFEKLYMNSCETKEEVSRTLSLFKEFTGNYIGQNQSCNSTEILNFLMKMEENKAIICNNIKIKNSAIKEKNQERMAVIQQQMTFAKNYSTLSKSLENKKQIYYENLLMAQEENHSLNKELSRLIQENKNIVKEIESVKEKTTKIKSDNKLLCTREYELMTIIINSDKECRDLSDALSRNSEIIKKKQVEYAHICEKLNTLTKIKEDIISSNQVKKTILLRKLFKARKFNEENDIAYHATSLLKSNLIKGVKKFTFEESLTFSEIFNRLKIFHGRQKEKLEILRKQSEEIKKIEEIKKDALRSNSIKFFSYISNTYQDIQINIKYEDFDNLADINDKLSSLHRVLAEKKNTINSQFEQTQEEFSILKTEIKRRNCELIEKMRNKRKIRTLKKLWNILKVIFKVRKDRKEKERMDMLADQEMQLQIKMEKLEREKNELLERENQEREKNKRAEEDRKHRESLEIELLERQRKEKERLEKERLERERESERLEKELLEKELLERQRKEKERLDKERLEKERLERERLDRERLDRELLERESLERERLERERIEKEKEISKKEKERLERERIEKDREILRKEKQRDRERLEKDKEILRKEKERELLEYDTGFQNFQNSQTEINIENRKSRRVTSRDVKQKEPPRRSKRNLPISKDTNNIQTSQSFNSSNNIPLVSSSFPNLKVDLLKIEESFNKKSNINTSNDNFLDEISKNINEISEFPVKNTFGDKKKRYMSSFNFI